jgi:[histone H3]-trimethyl-L-lysine4 demethylase
VTTGKKWSDLGRILGYRGIPGLSTQLKNSYARVILPYEHFCERVRTSQAMSPMLARDAHLKTHTNMQTSSKLSRLSTTITSADNTSPPGSPLTTTSSPLSEPPDESESKDVGGKSSGSRPRRSTRMGPQEHGMYL